MLLGQAREATQHQPGMPPTIKSTPTKLGWNTTNIDGHKSSLDVPSIDASASDKTDQNTVLLSWNDFVAAVFNQGDRPPSPSPFDTLVFPRDAKFSKSTNNYASSWEPEWHTSLVRDVMSDPSWAAAHTAFKAATQEADLYSPLRSILNLIASETRKTPAGQLAGATTHLTWLSTPDTALILPPLSKSPRSKPDLVGVFGTSCAEPGKLEMWAGHPNTWSARVAAVDVLVTVEVGFTKVKRPAMPPATSPSSIYAYTPSCHMCLPPGYVTSEGNVRDIRTAPIGPPVNVSRSTLNQDNREIFTMDAAPDVETEEDDIMEGVVYAEDDADPEGSDNPPPPPQIAAQDGLPPLIERVNGVYCPKNKAVQAVRYCAVLRQAQVFRTGAISIVVQNTEATFIYCDNSGTLITYPIDIFTPDFITTIIHLVLADFPQFGFDPIWVPSTRVDPTNHAERAKADPRNGIGRVLNVDETLYTTDRIVLRRFAIHGRGTTIIIVRRVVDGELHVLKCSFVVNTREEEAMMSIEAKKKGVSILTVVSWSCAPMSIWSLGVLSTRQPLQLRDRRTVCFKEVCWMLGTVPNNRDFLGCFLDAIYGTLYHLLLPEYVLTSVHDILYGYD